MKIRPWAGAVLALAVLTAASAQAQFAKPDDAIKYRQSALSVMGTHFTRLGAMATGRAAFDPTIAQESADIVAFMSKLPWGGFVEGSDQGARHRAKAEIWMEKDKFLAASQRLQEDTAKLAATARTGNLDQIRNAFGATAQSCKACHDVYRN